MSVKRDNIHYKGFTLIELLITIVIIAVLVGIGLPNYLDYMRKGRRPDAIQTLIKIATDQELFFSTNLPNSYSQTLVALGYGSDPQPSEQGYYSVSLAVTPGGCAAGTATPCTGFILTAAPTANQTGDGCGAFTLDNFGVKGKVGGDAALIAAQCW